MKTAIPFSLTLLLTLLLVTTSFADERSQLWGSMTNGGTFGKGVLYFVNSDGTNGNVAVIFNGSNGANPSGNLVQGPGNILYGTAMAGGDSGCGVLFKINAVSKAFDVLHHFTG